MSSLILSSRLEVEAQHQLLGPKKMAGSLDQDWEKIARTLKIFLYIYWIAKKQWFKIDRENTVARSRDFCLLMSCRIQWTKIYQDVRHWGWQYSWKGYTSRWAHRSWRCGEVWALFFWMGQYEDGCNGCRYWRFGSRVKILMLTSEHTCIQVHDQQACWGKEPCACLKLFRFPGFTTIWSVLRESRLGMLKEDIMLIAYGGAKETRIHLLKMQLSALETWNDLVWKKLPWWLWFILWLTNLFVKVRLLEEPPEHFGGWCDRTDCRFISLTAWVWRCPHVYVFVKGIWNHS